MMRILVIALLLFAAFGWAWADDVISMPTANQLKAGEVDVAVYYFGLDLGPDPYPQNVNLQQVCVGLTDKIEIDAYRADVDNDDDAVVVTTYHRFLSETPTRPDLVAGVKNIFGTETTKNPAAREDSGDRSYFVCAAKTLFLSPAMGRPPLVRVHAGLGTEDWTLFGEKRHDGLFGGLQFLITPEIGAVIEHDSEDLITGLSYMPKNTGLTIKGGTFGSDAWWVGLAYRKALLW